MPARSEKQRRFFYLVKATQQGKVSPKRVGSNVSKAATNMSPQDVDDFTHGKNLPKKKLEEIINCLEGLRVDSLGTPIEPTLEYKTDVQFDTTGKPIDPHFLGEEGDSETEQNPIANTFTQSGKKFEEYVGEFDGIQFSPKESEAIYLYKTEPITPTKEDEAKKVPIKYVKYQKTDDFSSNTTIILKQRQGNDLVFTAFQLNKPAQEEPTDQANPEETPDTDNIQVSKSKSFRDEIEGGKVLSDMLQKLEI